MSNKRNSEVKSKDQESAGSACKSGSGIESIAVVDLFLYVHPGPFFLPLALREAYTNIGKPGISIQVLFHSFATRVFMTTAIFLAAIWIYKCGPTIESFLSPREE